jgi:hypothetical protein
MGGRLERRLLANVLSVPVTTVADGENIDFTVSDNHRSADVNDTFRTTATPFRTWSCILRFAVRPAAAM